MPIKVKVVIIQVLLHDVPSINAENKLHVYRNQLQNYSFIGQKTNKC